MIGKLTGKIDEIKQTQIILDVQGVGYLITCPGRDLTHLVSGKLTSVYIHTYVKEDALELFGFLDPEDLKLFKYLISVSGIGPRLAMTMLTAHPGEEIKQAIIQADTSFFQTISGIGKKNAQKIIVELKTKFGSVRELDLTEADKQRFTELIAALKSLGYNTAEIKPLLTNIPSDLNATEEQVRWVLKTLH